MTDTELLELLIGFGALAVDVSALVQTAEKEYGTPTGLFDALDTTDRPLPGAGESVELLLKLVPTLCRRSLAEQIRSKPTVRSFEDAKELLRRYYIGVTREVAMILYLNDRDRVIGTLYFGSGNGNSVRLDPRAIFTKAKELGINTCIDTAGEPFTREGEWFKKFEALMAVTDTLLVDIKHIDEDEHIKLTGKSGKNIIDMFRYLDEIKKPIWIRHVLVPGITDNDEYLLKTRDFIRTLSNVQRVEILPYHGLGAAKYKTLGIPYALEKTESPTAERVENARKILECEKYEGWRK